ncbi:hypothetical protein [Modestobacter sp. KNN46-3]|uniref:hypothetical protein n=1 Tax=Modestobacter sp. KNN46-3 TaxID=2711218 RepID=UPI0013E0D72D|nr:hypothetical protein [Modestobacter sp. KNN46-3]
MTTPDPNPTQPDDLWGAWALVYTFIAGVIGITPDTRATHTVHAELAIHGLPRTEADAWALLDRLFECSRRIGWPDHIKATLLGAGLEAIYADGPGLDDPRWDGAFRSIGDGAFRSILDGTERNESPAGLDELPADHPIGIQSSPRAEEVVPRSYLTALRAAGVAPHLVDDIERRAVIADEHDPVDDDVRPGRINERLLGAAIGHRIRGADLPDGDA